VGTDTFFRIRPVQNILMRGCPSLVGSRPAKSVVHVAARVQIPHPAPFPARNKTIEDWYFNKDSHESKQQQLENSNLGDYIIVKKAVVV
jgi:hypothetical protein